MREMSAVVCALLLTAAAGCGGSQPSTASPSPVIASNSSQPPAAPGACVIGFDDLNDRPRKFCVVHRMRPLRRRDRRDLAGLHQLRSSRSVRTVPVRCRLDDHRRSRRDRNGGDVCLHLTGYLFEHDEDPLRNHRQRQPGRAVHDRKGAGEHVRRLRDDCESAARNRDRHADDPAHECGGAVLLQSHGP